MFAYLSINDLTFVNKRCFISLVVILNNSLRFLLVLLQVSFFKFIKYQNCDFPYS